MSTSCSSFASNSRVAVVPLLFLFLLALVSCGGSAEKKAEARFASLDPEVTYVGMQTCRQCHSDKYDTYIRTGMGRSFDAASKSKSAAKFGPHAEVYDKYRDLWYHPHWSDEQLFVEELRISRQDTLYRRRERIDHIVGSGQHTNSHLFSVNGYLYQAPVTYYTQEGRWDLPPGFEGGHNSRFSRKIELECISCHNAYPQLVTGSESKYEKVPNGIDCERCHGPGSRHVELKSRGEVVDTARYVDYSIVNPAKLPIDLQLDICQRCHIQGNAVLQPGKTFLDFRPGQHLSEVMDVYMPVYKGREDEHIMASHAERMKLSACFLASRKKAQAAGADRSLRPYQGAMTCVTCHDPHISVKETGPQTYNNACRNCHNSAKGSIVCSAVETKKMTFGGDCSGCHMPKNNTIDIPHVVTTDHRIGIPLKLSQKEAIREFVTLACINNPSPSPLSRATAYLNQFEKFVDERSYLDSALSYLCFKDDKEFSAFYHALVRRAHLAGDYREVIRLSEKFATIAPKYRGKLTDPAWTYYRIADAFVRTGDKSSGITWMKAAVRVLPFQLDFRARLASWLDDEGSVEEALAEYEFVLKEQPKQPGVMVNYGYLLLSRKQDLQRADSLYRAALALDPDHVQALVNLAGTSTMLGNVNLADRLLDRALRIDPSNQQARSMRETLSTLRR